MGPVDLSKNQVIKSSNEVSQICRPIRDFFNCTYFNYVKIDNKGGRSTVTDRPDFIIEYYKSPELYQTKAVVNMEQELEREFHLSCEFRDQLSYIVARNDFNIDNGITLIIPNSEYKELFYFGGTRDDHSNTRHYLSNMDMLYRFTQYFKEQARDILIAADKDKFYLPTPKINVESSVDDRKRELFFSETKINKYFVDFIGNIYLTKKEIECLYYLPILVTIKEISNKMYISPRTVEDHIQSLKQKLSCTSKRELLGKVVNTELGRMIRYCSEMGHQL